MTTHIAIDIESLALEADTVIASFAAIKFNPYGGVRSAESIRHDNMKIFYRLELQPQIIHKRKVDAGTLEWWMRQGENARRATFTSDKVNAVHPVQALRALRDFCMIDEIKHAWACPATFDLTAIAHMYKQYGEYNPIGYKNRWDPDPILFARGEANYPAEVEDCTTIHDPVDDCIRLVQKVQYVLSPRCKQ